MADQLQLLPAPVRPRRSRSQPPRPTATELPVARVAVLTALPHLDHPLDYTVPAALDSDAQPGVRVRVRLAGRLVDGYVLERCAAPESDRPLQPLRSVHGPPVLTPVIAALCREVADRYAGTFADVVRTAIPPRHARVEAAVLAASPGSARSSAADAAGAAPVPAAPDRKPAEGAPVPTAETPAPTAPDLTIWQSYRGGRALVTGLGGTPGPRVSWCSGPGECLPTRIAELAAVTVRAGRGVLVVAPDGADVGRIAEALGATGLAHVDLTARSGPQARYRAFLRILTGGVTVVVGTRGAVFSPVRALGLVVVVDDADESLAEPHAPGWHAREVAVLRAAAEGAALVLAGPSVSLEAQRMVAMGWLAQVDLPRTRLRSAAPLVQAAEQAAGRDPARAAARIPSVALQVLREAVGVGPVLVCVPRAGYLPFLACATCREPAVCPVCTQPLGADSPGAGPTCPDHPPAQPWRCPHCGGDRVRAGVVGVRRTAEELGRAVPQVAVVTSSAESGVVRRLAQASGVVVATPGAEPDPGPVGFAAVVLLDVTAALSRPGLRVPEEALHRWLRAASRVRPAGQGGRVLVVGDGQQREVQALIRWDPRGYAQRSVDERLALSLPPAVRTARITGPAAEAEALVNLVREHLGHRVLRCDGPLPGPEGESGTSAPPTLDAGRDPVAWQVAVALGDGAHLSTVLRTEQSRRSVRRAPVVTVRIDPVR